MRAVWWQSLNLDFSLRKLSESLLARNRGIQRQPLPYRVRLSARHLPATGQATRSPSSASGISARYMCLSTGIITKYLTHLVVSEYPEEVYRPHGAGGRE